MSWMDWFCHNSNGTLRGPVFCPNNCYVIGGEVWEQAGFGIVDIRLQFRDKDTGDEDWTEWLCKNNQGTLRGPITVPFIDFVAGMAVEEQAGFGVIDLWLTYRERCSTSDGVLTSDKFTGNPNATWHRGPLSAPAGNFITGIEVSEQAGYGVVDIRLHYSAF